MLTKLGPESGRGFAAARNWNQPAHPSCSQFLSAVVGWPGNAGKGWALLKAGFTFALAEKLFKFNSITRQTHELFHKSLPMNPLGAPASRRPVGSRKLELADETPALPGTVFL